MAKNSEVIELTGSVVDVLPNSTFKVKVNTTNEVLRISFCRFEILKFNISC